MLLLALAACTSPTDVHVGPIDGTDAVVGLAGDRLYVCGGPDTMATLNQWFDVTIDGDELFGEDDETGWTVIGSRRGGWTGDVVAAVGDVYPFALDPARDAEGPYAAADPVGECPAGAVVVGGRMQGVACAAALAPAQVVPVGVIGSEPGPIEVRTEGDPSLEFVVVPVGS